MRLVERVAGEGQHGVPQRLDGRLGEVVVQHALSEPGVCLLQLGELLLAHGATQQVGLAEGVAGHLLRQLHDLLLVNHQAVRLAENHLERLFELRVNRLDLLPTVLAVGVIVVRVHAHRTRPVQGQDGDDVLEAGGLHTAEQIAHGAAVELEDAESVSARKQVEGRRVVERECVEVDVDAAVGLDVVDGVADDGEVSQTQEVHLEQADGLARRVVPAGDDRAVLRTLPHRNGVGERLGGHDDRAGVHACVADQALEALGRLVDGRDVGVGVDQRSNLDGFLVALVRGVGDARHGDVLGHDGRRKCLVI